MLVLCSNGLSSEKILAYTKDKVCTCKTAALVVTADNEYKENIKFYTENVDLRLSPPKWTGM